MTRWRPLSTEDGRALQRLYHAWESRHDLPYRTDLSEIEHDLTDPEGDIAARSQVAVSDNGDMLALAWVFMSGGSARAFKHRAILWIVAHPDHVALEVEALARAEWMARRVLDEIDDGRKRVLRAWSPAKLTDRIERFTAAGYPPVRYFAEMLRDLDGPLPTISVSEKVAVVAWDDRFTNDVWQVSNIAFADHWGSVDKNLEDWRRTMVEDPHHRPDLSFVAISDDRVVGYCMNRVYPEEFEIRKMKEGYIASLGVLPQWRRKGIASALIVASMERFLEEGFDHTSLHVDADSPTGAFGLYERLGFTQSDLSVSLVKEL